MASVQVHEHFVKCPMKEKNDKTLRNSAVALIEHVSMESSILSCQKLKINGAGCRAEIDENFAKRMLTLKLSCSHLA